MVSVGDSIHRMALARRIRVPAIARQELEIHRGADCSAGGGGDRRGVSFFGLIRLEKWRHVEEFGPQLIIRLTCIDPKVICSLGEHAGGEFVGPLSRGPLARQALWVNSAGVLDELTSIFAIDSQVGGHVAVDEIEREEGEFGNIAVEREPKPVSPRVALFFGGFGTKRQIRPIVGQAVDRLAECESVGLIGLVVGLGLESDVVKRRGIGNWLFDC